MKPKQKAQTRKVEKRIIAPITKKILKGIIVGVLVALLLGIIREAYKVVTAVQNTATTVDTTSQDVKNLGLAVGEAKTAVVEAQKTAEATLKKVSSQSEVLSEIVRGIGTLVLTNQSSTNELKASLEELKKSIPKPAPIVASQESQILGQLAAIQSQMMNNRQPTPVSQPELAVTGGAPAVQTVALPSPTYAGPSSAQGGVKGQAAVQQTKWKRHEMAGRVSSQKFSALDAREGKIRIENKGRVSMTQYLPGGWGKDSQTKPSMIPDIGDFSVHADANYVSFRLESEYDRLVVWEML